MVDGVLVPREALRKALLRLKKFANPRKGERALLFTEGEMLRIRTPRLEVSIGVEGDLLVGASIEAQMLIRLHRVLPRDNPLLLQVVGNKLHIGSFSVTCDLVKDPPPFTRPPATPQPTRSPVMMLRLRQEHDPTTLALHDLTGEVQGALIERDRRISRALKALELFQVERADLVKLIDECVMRDLPLP